MARRTFVYVDGFNLYYRALKGTPYRWLNLKALAEQVLDKQNHVLCIKYFTARVTGQRNPDSPRDQAQYLAAIETLPEVKTFFGRFLAKTITRPLVYPAPGQNPFVEVHTMEEKGSDVNLASHLLNDGWASLYDVAAVISNDSDLETPIKMVAQSLKKPVGLICPVAGQPQPDLAAAATFVRRIRPAHLRASQFPPTLTVNGKTITKPSDW